MNSYDIVAQAVREFWNNSIPQLVIAFFYQKYEFERDDKWEWCEELVTCTCSDDYETVVFEYDFCEGQTQVKNIKIVPLDEITTYYAEHHGLKRQNREKRESEDKPRSRELWCRNCGYHAGGVVPDFDRCPICRSASIEIIEREETNTGEKLYIGKDGIKRTWSEVFEAIFNDEEGKT